MPRDCILIWRFPSTVVASTQLKLLWGLVAWRGYNILSPHRSIHCKKWPSKTVLRWVKMGVKGYFHNLWQPFWSTKSVLRSWFFAFLNDFGHSKKFSIFGFPLPWADPHILKDLGQGSFLEKRTTFVISSQVPQKAAKGPKWPTLELLGKFKAPWLGEFAISCHHIW